MANPKKLKMNLQLFSEGSSNVDNDTLDNPLLDIPKVDTDFDKIVENKINEMKESFLNELKLQADTLNSEKESFKTEKNRLVVTELLRTNNIPLGFIDYIYDDNLEIVNQKILEIGVLVQELVNKGIETRLKTSNYTPGGDSNTLVQDSNFEKPSYMV